MYHKKTLSAAHNFIAEFIIRSTSGNGDRDAGDPNSSNCVKYGDSVFLQNNGLDHRWLNGARGSGNEGVLTRNHLGSSYEQNNVANYYKWKIRSTVGNGSTSNSDPKDGQCLLKDDIIYLQVMGMNSRWLSGGRSSGNEGVLTRNILGSSYEQNTVGEYYRWIIRREAGDGGRTVTASNRNEHGQLTSNSGAYIFKSYNELKANYDTCKAEANSDSDLDQDEKYEAHKECLADNFNGPIGMSLELVFGDDASPGYICGIKDAVKNDNKKLPGFCCLDAPFQLSDNYWGHEVRQEIADYYLC